ncbi:MAG: GNAT family N-acetyltransferase [Mangrovicoccus sp.]
MTSAPQPLFRTADQAELSQILDWAAAEGWNPGLADAEAFFASDPKGFFVAEIDEQITAAISLVNHCGELAFLGLYICLPQFRSQGIGYGLWSHALGHAGERVIGLDGVPAQEANYAKSGFKRLGASRRFAGQLDAAPQPGLRIFQDSDLARLMQLDKAAIGFERPGFLTAWTKPSETRLTVVTEALDGFATIRRCREGTKIGPIIAPDLETGLALARAASAQLPSEITFIDVAPNSPLAGVLEAHGFTETFATARMYRGAPPQAGPSLLSIATMELG